MWHLAATPWTNPAQLAVSPHTGEAQVPGAAAWWCLSTRAGGRTMGFPQSQEWGCRKVGDQGEPGHHGCLWFLEKGAQDWRRFAKPKQATLAGWLSLLPMAHASTEIQRKLLHRIQWQCSELSNKTRLSYIHPLNLGLPIFLHITEKIPCRLILE